LAFKPQEAKRLSKRKPSTLVIMTADPSSIRWIEKGIVLGEAYSRATVYARDLVNEPASRMTPAHLRTHAERITANDKNIKLKILDATDCEKLGMGAFLAVAKGSDEPPYFFHMVYRPKRSNKTHKKVAFIGKGLTFDSGGLSLKPTEHMETMKCDMAGAAVVIGVFSVLSDISPNVEVHGLIAACENMPSGKAMRPGDIVTAMNGKSIEILNTDAEGRLTLADALAYAAKKIKPDCMIDIATLTGACMVALGTDVAGLMTNEDKFFEQIKKAAATAGEPIWRLPLPDDYAPLVVGDYADLRNTSRAKYGGALTAGLFLKEFAGDVPWAHLDIAGPAFAERDVNPYMNKGGTGYGVRTMLNWLNNL
jgi:leucyl aminopeptidase